MGFLLSIQGSCSRLAMKTMVERIIQAVGNFALADADHRVTTHFKCLSHLLIGPSGARCMAINFQEDAGMSLLSDWSFASGEQLLQKKPLFFTQHNIVRNSQDECCNPIQMASF